VRATLALLCALAATGCAGERSLGGEAGRPPHRPADQRHFEVAAMTYNVRYGSARDGPDSWPLRRELALDVLRRRAPDVVGMQEVLAFQRAEFLAACPGYAAVGVGREADGSGEACPIFYRSGRFALVASGTFWLSATPDLPGSRGWDASLPRVCTWALFEERGGGRFQVFNVHFDHLGATARLESARLVAARIAVRRPAHPALLLGDLNAGEDSEPVRALHGLVDTFRALHPDSTEVGTFHGFRGGTDGAKIDFVLATPAVGVLGAEIVRDEDGGRFPSDHYPVAARVLIPVGTKGD